MHKVYLINKKYLVVVAAIDSKAGSVLMVVAAIHSKASWVTLPIDITSSEKM